MKLNLPSNFVHYDKKSFESEKLTVQHISKVYEAKIQDSTRVLLHALQDLTKFNLFEMLPQDFRWYMRQLSITGYSKRTEQFEWTSKYGNKQLVEIDLTRFEVVEYTDALKLLKEFRWPTMQDICDIEEIDSVSKRWLYEQAQYINKPTWEQRIKALDNDTLIEISKIKKLFWGVREYTLVYDRLFEPKVWLAKCKKMKELLDDEQSKFASQYLMLKDEIEKWENVILQGSPCEVDPEYVHFPLSCSILLP